MTTRQPVRAGLRRAPASAAPPKPSPSTTTNGAVDDSSIARLIRSMLPERTAEDVMAGMVRVTLGGRIHTLAVLPIGLNDAWKVRFNESFATVFAAMERPDANAGAIMSFLSGMTDVQIDLLMAYDVRYVGDTDDTESAGQLPDIAWIRRHSTEPELLRAVLGVTAAAFPFAATIIEMLRESPDLQRAMTEAMASVGSMNGSRPTTGGRRDRSAEA